jgi:CRP-like cAMP-binding protein
LDLREILKEVPLLADVDSRTRERILEQGHVKRFGVDEYVIRQGDPASALYILLNGRLLVEKEIDGVIEKLTELVPYAFFGEVALIENTPRTASVKAKEQTDCLLLPSWEFTALMKEYPEMSAVVLRELIHRLHRKEHEVF